MVHLSLFGSQTNGSPTNGSRYLIHRQNMEIYCPISQTDGSLINGSQHFVHRQMVNDENGDAEVEVMKRPLPKQ